MKSTREIERMRASGRIVAQVLAAMETAIRPGVTTAELDALAESIIAGHSGARPAFKGYGGFPAAICASVNDEVVHGIPSKSRTLAAGDIVGIDVGVLLDGYHADAARTWLGVREREAKLAPSVSTRRLAIRLAVLQTRGASLEKDVVGTRAADELYSPGGLALVGLKADPVG